LTLSEVAAVVIGGLMGGWVAALLVAVTHLEREIRKLHRTLEDLASGPPASTYRADGPEP
jgi:hypothetical protein